MPQSNSDCSQSHIDFLQSCCDFLQSAFAWLCRDYAPDCVVIASTCLCADYALIFSTHYVMWLCTSFVCDAMSLCIDCTISRWLDVIRCYFIMWCHCVHKIFFGDCSCVQDDLRYLIMCRRWAYRFDLVLIMHWFLLCTRVIMVNYGWLCVTS